MSQIEVQIMGQGYALACPDGSEERLEAAVSNVDLAMCKIRDAGKIKARERIAVLAAINIAFDSTSPAVAPASTPTEDLNTSAASNAMLESLLKRLDEVLAVDGQLL
jgi:cell division protein ZapA